MNGYNTRWGKACLPLILEEILGPSAWSVDDGLVEKGRVQSNPIAQNDGDGASSCVNDHCSNENQQQQQISTELPLYSQYTFLIAFGANDSCLPDGTCSRHHVPLSEYSSNLKDMIQMIKSWGHLSSPNFVSVALLTPPPCNTQVVSTSRHNENVTNLYAQECINLGEEMNVPVVDLWNGMQLPIERDDDESVYDLEDYEVTWKLDYLSDGLHLTPLGNYKMFQLVVQMLERPMHSSSFESNDNTAGRMKKPLGLGLSVTQLPRHYPDHSMVDAENPEKSFRN
jgi:lysophospholipase L1-like esterase